MKQKRKSEEQLNHCSTLYTIADYAGVVPHMAYNHGTRVRISYLQLFCLFAHKQSSVARLFVNSPILSLAYSSVDRALVC